jgi:hypothetical protein
MGPTGQIDQPVYLNLQAQTSACALTFFKGSAGKNTRDPSFGDKGI